VYLLPLFRAVFHREREHNSVWCRQTIAMDRAKTEARSEKLMTQKVFALVFLVNTPTAVKYEAAGGKVPDTSRWDCLPGRRGYTPLRQRVITCALPTSTKRASRWTGLLKTLHCRMQ